MNPQVNPVQLSRNQQDLGRVKSLVKSQDDDFGFSPATSEVFKGSMVPLRPSRPRGEKGLADSRIVLQRLHTLHDEWSKVVVVEWLTDAALRHKHCPIQGGLVAKKRGGLVTWIAEVCNTANTTASQNSLLAYRAHSNWLQGHEIARKVKGFEECADVKYLLAVKEILQEYVACHFFLAV